VAPQVRKWSFFSAKLYRDHIESYLSEFGYSELVQEQFEKMVFSLVDPLVGRVGKETKIRLLRIVGNQNPFPTYSKLPVYFRKLSEVLKQNRNPEAKSRSGSKIAIRKQNRDPEAKSLAIKLNQKLLTRRL
jgi:hypothetical protein